MKKEDLGFILVIFIIATTLIFLGVAIEAAHQDATDLSNYENYVEPGNLDDCSIDNNGSICYGLDQPDFTCVNGSSTPIRFIN